MNKRIESLLKQFASMIIVCAPNFSSGSYGALVVNTARNIDDVIEKIKNEDKKDQ